MMKILIIYLILILFSAPVFAQDKCGCAGEYQVVGPSFKVHGRFSAWNGNPTRRIWITGTKRIIGIREETPLPKNIEELMKSFDDEVYGNFTVCPLTNKKNGVMQIACVQSASNLIKKKRK